MAEVVRERFLRVRNPIMWACLVTAGFVGLIVWFGLAETCNVELFPKGDCPPKWRHLRVAPPNEVGDTLAGLAGVLAFIWLIATVLLQSVELGEQRRVLSLQREEMEEQRKATQDMAKAMAAQAKIFEDEQLQRSQDRARREFDQHLMYICAKVRLEASQTELWRSIVPGPRREERRRFHLFGDIAGGEVEETIELAFNTISVRVSQLNQALRLGGTVIPSADRSYYGLVNSLVADLVRLRPRLSEDQIVRFRRLGIERVSQNLQLLMDDERFWERAKTEYSEEPK